MKIYKREFRNRNKPKEIRNAEDLLHFVEGVPADRFIVDSRHDETGRCCILGHLDNHYWNTPNHGRDGFNECQLAAVNNGLGFCREDYLRFIRKDADTRGPAVKDRLIAFLRLQCTASTRKSQLSS